MTPARSVAALLILAAVLTAGTAGERLQAAAPVAAAPAETAAPGRLLGRQGGEELDELALFALRDRVFRHTPGGRRATELFYTHLGDLVATIAAEPQLLDLGQDWLASWQGPLRELVEGRGASATLGDAQVQSLLDYVTALEAAAATPELRQALQRERARLDVPSWAGLSMTEWLQQVDRLSCAPSANALCLNGGRFRVEAEWRTPQGRTGRANAVPLTSDTGYFWFFGATNVEAIVKVHDGCGFNQRFWVFAAGLTNVEVELSVADTATGETRTYRNPLGAAFEPLQDIGAFATCSAATAGAAAWREAAAADRAAPPAVQGYPPEPAGGDGGGDAPRPRELAGKPPGRPDAAAPRAHACTPGPETLCLREGRFRVETEWETPQGNSGRGKAVAITPDTGYFWFFRSDNVEEVVKVHDGCGFNQRFWVFAAGLTNVRVTTRVTDTHTGVQRTYTNPLGQAFLPLQDTDAFPG